MPSIKISDFKGKSPRVSEKLLPGDFAQTANNCGLLRGKISAVKDFESEVETGNLITAPVTIYKFEDDWLSWDTDTDIVRSPLGTTTPRIYMSNGLAYPKQSSSRMTTLLGAYFTINAPTNAAPGTDFQTEFYVYITVGGAGPVPPVDAGKTTITAAILVGDTDAQAATKIAAAIQANGLFVTATAVGSVITITNANIGNCVPPISNDCGFTASTTTLGALAVAQITTIDVNAGPDPTSGAGYPRLTWRLGVPAPDEALALTLAGEGDGYPIKSVNWVYTYVTAWGEESKPSPATETVDIEGTAQKTNVTCEAPDMLELTAGGAGKYFTFTTTAATYDCWYTIDGHGVVPPAAAGTPIKVELLGLDNPDNIADKIAAAITAVPGILCSATAEGKLITITNGVVGNVADTVDVDTGFPVIVTQQGTGALPEISTVNTERLIHGSYFVLHTSLKDSYYVWYQIAAVPSIIVDFTPQTVIEGDYFYFYLLFPGLDPNKFINPNIEKKIVVYFEEKATVEWTKAVTYVLNDVVWDSVNGTYVTYRCKVATSNSVFPPFMNTTDWTESPGYPADVAGDKFIRAEYDLGAATDNEFAEPAYDGMVKSTNGLTDVARFDYDPATSEITITSLIIGDIKADPAADNGTAPKSPDLLFTDAYGSTVSDDPGVAGKTGIKVDIVIDDPVLKIAEKTAEAINGSDDFSCAKPYSTTITIVNDRGGVTEDAEDGNTGFTIAELQAGAVQTASFVMPAVPAANADVNISHIRLYRLVTADNGSAEYQYVPPYAPYDEDTVYAVGDYLSYSGYGYYCMVVPVAGILPTETTNFSKLDTLDLPLDVALLDGINDGHPYDSTLAEILPTEDWDMPPDDLHGLTLFDNGIMAGFSKNSVYVTEPLHPYAFPDIYSLLFPEVIVGLGYMPGTIIVLTEGAPQGIIGNDPTTLSQTPFPYPQPCVSKRGITMTENGVIYPCPDGFFMISQNGGSLITKPLYTKTQWVALGAENFIGTYFDGKAFYSVDGSNTSAFIDFQETLFIVDFDHTLPDTKENYTYDMVSDGDDLYYLFKKETAATYEIYKYRGAATYKTFTWKSKKHQWPYATNFACGRVIADWATAPTVTVTLYVDGVLKQTIAVTDSNVFRLVSGFIGRIFEIQITGAVDVDFFGISQTPMDISL